MISVVTPLKEKDLKNLSAGDEVLISGLIYTARDEAHQRFVEALKRKEKLPLKLEGQILFYASPTPAKTGKVVGSIGPTTSGRLDVYTPLLLELGLKGMIGKGKRSLKVKEAIKKYRAVYFIAIGGAAAFLSQFVKKAEVVAYEDLGPEAVYKLEVKDFPVIVGIDTLGNDIYER
ncbi:MAG: Fe-S-containing hydro-lyase [Candidatus Subteraquimicrobiales bacterium]|nr:Fe-S-containing hydro-lyase [Candidatus Subteraquimicrobiales bacterium]